MIYMLNMKQVLRLHDRVIAQSGGGTGIRDMAALESCLAQPHASFGGQALYPDLASQAAALGHALVCNHPFVDGNKRIGHAAMEVALVLNRMEIDASVDIQEEFAIELASGQMTREDVTMWLRAHIVAFTTSS